MRTAWRRYGAGWETSLPWNQGHKGCRWIGGDSTLTPRNTGTDGITLPVLRRSHFPLMGSHVHPVGDWHNRISRRWHGGHIVNQAQPPRPWTRRGHDVHQCGIRGRGPSTGQLVYSQHKIFQCMEDTFDLSCLTCLFKLLMTDSSTQILSLANTQTRFSSGKIGLTRTRNLKSLLTVLVDFNTRRNTKISAESSQKCEPCFTFQLPKRVF